MAKYFYLEGENQDTGVKNSARNYSQKEGKKESMKRNKPDQKNPKNKNRTDH